MKYKIGDRVKVREDLEIGATYGNIDLLYTMERVLKTNPICTIIQIVVDFDGSYVYKLKENEEGYSYSDEMFSGLADEPIRPEPDRTMIAAMAMQALLANPNCSYNAESIAEDSLVYTDALITELNKPKP